MNIFRNMRLKPSILTSFVVLTVPVFFTIIAVTYLSNDRIARANAQAAGRALPQRGDRQHPGRFQSHQVAGPLGRRDRRRVSSSSTPSSRCFGYFQTILVHSPKIVSVYVGLEDGSFRQTRRIDAEVKIQDQLPPKGSQLCLPLDPPGGRRAHTRSLPLPRRRSQASWARAKSPPPTIRAAGCGIAAPPRHAAE